MQHSPALQQMLEQLLARYRLDADEREVRLQLEGGDQLVIAEERTEQRIRFSRYVPMGGRIPLKELEILFFVSEEGRWIPYEMYRDVTGRRVYGRVNAVHRSTLTILDSANQEALAAFCDIWAFRLRDQGWLTRATKLDVAGLALDEPFLWPEPTTPEPDLETIEEWMREDGGCEATDSCWVEPDGVCPHNHPSWLLRLGLV